ncbi:MAG: S41 family peptidase [Planctomycetes bacterium]|nr:S41 family peptidase [Planctomycetota bacterium]
MIVMHWNRSWRLLALLLAMGAAWTVRADDKLTAAYGAILRGDYATGREVLARLSAERAGDAQVARAEGWLESFNRIVVERDQLRAQTFDWNVEHAKAALAEGKTYLALSFAAQAASYAPNEIEYASEPWIEDLSVEALVQARRHERADEWTKAHSYYALLERIHEDSQDIKDLRERALRHARLSILYEDEDALQRRIRDVDWNLLSTAIRLINRNYWEKPDFARMADGALDNLEALCGTTKLYGFMDGVANPDLREFFLKKLEERRDKFRHDKSFGYKDLIRLYREIATINAESIALPEGLLVIEFVEGAAQQLDDYTAVIWPADAVEFDKLMMGGFEGVGIQLGLDEYTGRLKVVTPLESSPALEAGIQAGDLIIAVDGESTKDWDTDDAVRNIMGPAGSEVILTIYRPSRGKRIDYPLNRRQIRLRTVRGVSRVPGSNGNDWNYMLDEEQGIAYIRLTGFNPDSSKELSDALQKARAAGMKALVLDLRFNPGGLLDVAVETVSTFLKNGEIVSTSGRRDSAQRLSVNTDSSLVRFPDLPLVVLANEYSASASEILAGALQDHNRAVVLGERTFGKGSVQRVLLMGQQARLKLTTALYYLPSGRTPHKAPNATQWGVDPDWDVKLTPKELRKIITRQNEEYIIHSAAEDDGEELDKETRQQRLAELKADEATDEDDTPLLSEEDITLLDSDKSEAADVDPLVETALLHLRVKLAGKLPWPRQLAAAKADKNE